MNELKKRGYNEKWNNDDDVNHQSVTELTLQLIYICTVAAPLSLQILCRVDHCMQRPAPGRLTTHAALRLITALWPHVLPETHRRQLSILFIYLAYYRRPWELLFGLSGGARLFRTVD